MSLLRPLIRTILMLLIVAFGSGTAFALPLGWDRVDHTVAQQNLVDQSPNLAFAARAPPQTGDNVAIAGASSAGAADVHALYNVASLAPESAFSHSSIAPNSVGGSTRIVPGGGLQAHESAGGHLIQRHVGQTDADLIARLNAQPNITAASSFPSRATAENAVSSALDANTTRIDDFLSGSRTRLVLNHDTGSVVGSVVQSGSTTSVSSTSVRVVLQRDASMPTGYRIVTGFPTP